MTRSSMNMAEVSDIASVPVMASVPVVSLETVSAVNPDPDTEVTGTQEVEPIDGARDRRSSSPDVTSAAAVNGGGKCNLRDSGVDSMVSQSLQDSPFATSDLADGIFSEPVNLETLEILLSECAGRSTDSSYYEDIELMHTSAGRISPSDLYLDPCTTRDSTHNVRFGHVETPTDQKVLLKGSLLIAETEDASILNLTGCTEAVTSPDIAAMTSYKGTVICYDKEGLAYYIPSELIKRYGDPRDESWFYPIPISAREATIFLSRERQRGCFVVYAPAERDSRSVYILSVCRGGTEVVHYPIVENVRGDVMIDGHDHSFMNVCDLVEYFRRNQSHLAVRLRRSMKESRLPIVPGNQYPSRYEIRRSAIQLSGRIIGQGKYGAICLGEYERAPVLVKVLQSDSSTEDEDDFIEEAQTLIGLNHENVVRLVGVSCCTRPFYIVSEYFEKGTLKDCVVSGRTPHDNIDVLFDICIQIVSAMVYLENLHYVIHRDLAASNFFVTSDFLIKLANFERARHVVDDSYCACASEEIPIRWAAPEVLTESFYSTKSDVWSVGVVFWELFSRGALPYHPFTDSQVAVFVAEGGRLDKPPGCANDLYSMMKSCWKHRPEDRPSFSMLQDKIKGQSSIYYVNPQKKPGSLSYRPATAVSDTSKNNPPLPVKIKGQSHSKPGTPTTPATPSFVFSNKIVQPAASGRESRVDYALKTISERRNHSSGTLSEHTRASTLTGCERMPTSSSDSGSIMSASVTSGYYTKDDMSRGDKIRKSIRKLIKGKKTAK